MADTSQHESDKRLAERLEWEADQALELAKALNNKLQELKYTTS